MPRLLKSGIVTAAVVMIACSGRGEMPMNEAPNTDPQKAAERSASNGRPIRDVAGIRVPPRASAEGGPLGSERPFVNEELNSRLRLATGNARWSIRWSKPVQGDVYPFFVMTEDDRILIQGRSSWQLFGADGESLALGPTASSDVVLDASKPLFYMADKYGYLAAFSLKDGAIRYRASITGVQTYFRQYIARRGSRFLVASWEQDMNTHGTVVPSNGVLEVRDFGDPVSVQEEFAGGIKEIAREDFTTPRLFAAATGQVVVAATQDEIVFTDFEVRHKARFTGAFEPLALSLDETGRAYMIVKTAAGTALWCVNKGGERVYAYPLPHETTLVQQPPAVGFDHRAFVHSIDTILCIGPDGKLLWQVQPGMAIAGLAITADDHLIVSAGHNLFAYTTQGIKGIVLEFAPDQLLTPPALARNGDLVVASRTKLYRLSASR